MLRGGPLTWAPMPQREPQSADICTEGEPLCFREMLATIRVQADMAKEAVPQLRCDSCRDGSVLS